MEDAIDDLRLTFEHMVSALGPEARADSLEEAIEEVRADLLALEAAWKDSLGQAVDDILFDGPDPPDDIISAAERLADYLRLEPPDTARRVCDALLNGYTHDFSLILGP